MQGTFSCEPLDGSATPYQCDLLGMLSPFVGWLAQTQVVCTLGPKSRSVEVCEELLRAGMSVARFNFSHGSHEYHQVRLRCRLACCAARVQAVAAAPACLRAQP